MNYTPEELLSKASKAIFLLKGPQRFYAEGIIDRETIRKNKEPIFSENSDQLEYIRGWCDMDDALKIPKTN